MLIDRSLDTSMLGRTMSGDETPLLVPTLEQREIPRCNLVWCASFQLAWNRLSERLGGEVKVCGAEDVARARETRSSDPLPRRMV